MYTMFVKDTPNLVIDFLSRLHFTIARANWLKLSNGLIIADFTTTIIHSLQRLNMNTIFVGT